MARSDVRLWLSQDKRTEQTFVCRQRMCSSVFATMGRTKVVGIVAIMTLTVLNVWMSRYISPQMGPVRSARKMRQAVQPQENKPKVTDLLVLTVEDIHPIDHLREAGMMETEVGVTDRALTMTTQVASMTWAPGFIGTALPNQFTGITLPNQISGSDQYPSSGQYNGQQPGGDRDYNAQYQGGDPNRNGQYPGDAFNREQYPMGLSSNGQFASAPDSVGQYQPGQASWEPFSFGHNATGHRMGGDMSGGQYQAGSSNGQYLGGQESIGQNPGGHETRNQDVKGQPLILLSPGNRPPIVQNKEDNDVSGQYQGSQAPTMHNVNSGQNMGSQLSSGQNLGSQSSNYQNIGSQLSSDQNMGSQLSSDQNMGSQLSSDQNMGSQLSSDQHMGSQSSNDQNIGSQRSSDQNMGSQLSSDQNMGNQPSNGQNMGSQPYSGQSVGSQPSSNQNMGSQPYNAQNMGSQLSSHQTMGSQLSSDQTMGSQSSNDQNMGSQLSNDQNMGIQLSSDQNMGSQLSSDQNMGSQPSSGQDVVGQASSGQDVVGQPFSGQDVRSQSSNNQIMGGHESTTQIPGNYSSNGQFMGDNSSSVQYLNGKSSTVQYESKLPPNDQPMNTPILIHQSDYQPGVFRIYDGNYQPPQSPIDQELPLDYDFGPDPSVDVGTVDGKLLSQFQQIFNDTKSVTYNASKIKAIPICVGEGCKSDSNSILNVSQPAIPQESPDMADTTTEMPEIETTESPLGLLDMLRNYAKNAVIEMSPHEIASPDMMLQDHLNTVFS